MVYRCGHPPYGYDHPGYRYGIWDIDMGDDSIDIVIRDIDVGYFVTVNGPTFFRPGPGHLVRSSTSPMWVHFTLRCGSSSSENSSRRCVAAHIASGTRRSSVQRRNKLKQKATFETSSSYPSFNRLVPVALDAGLIGSTCTTLPRYRGASPAA